MEIGPHYLVSEWVKTIVRIRRVADRLIKHRSKKPRSVSENRKGTLFTGGILPVGISIGDPTQSTHNLKKTSVICCKAWTNLHLIFFILNQCRQKNRCNW
jgi:hypothetical protein